MKKKILLIICICIDLLVFYHLRSVRLPNEVNKQVISLLKEKYQIEDIDFIAVSYDLLDKKVIGDELILYGNFCILSYDLDESIENPYSGYHDFMALNMHKDKNNNYSLKDIWTPTDGSNYLSSLLKKFPLSTWTQILFDNKYSNELYEDCQSQLSKYMSLKNRNT